MIRPEVILNGKDLTIEEIVAIGIGDKAVALDPAALEQCRRSRTFLEQVAPASSMRQHLPSHVLRSRQTTWVRCR
jgi:histidine ammonia-lyase